MAAASVSWAANGANGQQQMQSKYVPRPGLLHAGSARATLLRPSPGPPPLAHPPCAGVEVEDEQLPRLVPLTHHHAAPHKQAAAQQAGRMALPHPGEAAGGLAGNRSCQRVLQDCLHGGIKTRAAIIACRPQVGSECCMLPAACASMPPCPPPCPCRLALQRYPVAGPAGMPTGRFLSISASCSISSSSLQQGSRTVWGGF